MSNESSALFEKYDLDHCEPEFEPNLLDEPVRAERVDSVTIAAVLGDDDFPF